LKFLLDASALLPLATRSGKQLLAEVARADLFTTDLAMYEACNGLWKLATLLKTITLKDAADIAVIVHELTARTLIKTISVTSIDLPHTLAVAQKAQVTFYDASYIEVAQKIDANLVTEDQKLRRAARNSVKTTSFLQLQKELAENL
jgi:predicted nucleic acid-binding protein